MSKTSKYFEDLRETEYGKYRDNFLKLSEKRFNKYDKELVKNLISNKNEFNILIIFKEKYNLNPEECKIINNYNFFYADKDYD